MASKEPKVKTRCWLGLDQAVVTPRKRPSALALSYTIITNNNNNNNNNNNEIEQCNLTD
jgi:hypothetical protein